MSSSTEPDFWRRSSSARSWVELSEKSGSPVTTKSVAAQTERPDRRQRRVAQAVGPARPPAHPEEIEAGQQPRLRTQESRRRQQHEHRQATARPAGFERPGPDHDRHERDVDVAAHGKRGEVEARQHQQGRDRPDEGREAKTPEPVGAGGQHGQREQGEEHQHPVRAVAEQRQPGADEDRERMLGGRPVGLEARQMEVEQLPSPDQRVVAVVVRIGLLDEEADQRQQDQHAETPRGRASRRRRAKASQQPQGSGHASLNGGAFHRG